MDTDKLQPAQPGRPGRLVHVGPHKTGTTTVQAAFHHNRKRLKAAGVIYLGDQLQPTTAVKALTGAEQGPRQERGLREWDALMAQAESHKEGTVVLSSEFLCEADASVARRVVDDLGRGVQERPQVVVTLRPLAKILPSQWQQFVQSGSESPLEQWMEWVLKNYESDPLPLVWRRHRHHDVVARWAEAAGAENVTVVVADDTQPQLLPQVFADMLDLPYDVLVPPKPVANRSLTMEEAEAVRLFNKSFNLMRSRQASDDRKPAFPDLTMDQRMAAWRTVKRSKPEERYHRVGLPASVVDRVRALAFDMVEAIKALEVKVIGDLHALTEADGVLADDALQPAEVGPQLVAEVATALLGQVMAPSAAPAEATPQQPARGWPRLLRRRSA